MRASPVTLAVVFPLLLAACGDDTGGGGGAGGGGAASTAASAGDGGGGPTTTGAGGILDDGTEEAIAACDAAYDAGVAVSGELGCPVPDREEYCADNAPSWVPCVPEWSAYFVCVGGATTAETCACIDDAGDDYGITCGEDTACAAELDAIDGCEG